MAKDKKPKEEVREHLPAWEIKLHKMVEKVEQEQGRPKARKKPPTAKASQENVAKSASEDSERAE